MLLIRRTDNGNWSLPGGGIELGESVAQAARRETLEETGIACEITGVRGIYSNPGHVIEYTSDGEVRQEFSIVLTGRPVSGVPTPSDESSQVAWVGGEDLVSLPMHASMRARLDHAAGGRPPLSVSSDRIARPAVRAAMLLSRLGPAGRSAARDGTDGIHWRKRKGSGWLMRCSMAVPKAGGIFRAVSGR